MFFIPNKKKIEGFRLQKNHHDIEKINCLKYLKLILKMKIQVV